MPEVLQPIPEVIPNTTQENAENTSDGSDDVLVIESRNYGDREGQFGTIDTVKPVPEEFSADDGQNQ